jgi:hypothetical protein
MKTHTAILVFAVLGLSACDNIKLVRNVSASSCAVDSTVSDLIAAKFEGVSTAELQTFAIDLLPCVGDSDPEIRDGVVFESMVHLLRNQKLDQPTQLILFDSLLDMLEGPDVPGGFLKPFAALDLSEVVRADRVEPYLSDEKRQRVVDVSAHYLIEIADYRGFHDQEGWRHAIAHTSDVMLQLTLNENISDPQLLQMRQAIATQITPDNGHAYIHGESERLARPILYMARRSTFLQEDWDAWFAKVGDPTPFEDWNAVFKSEAGLAKLHNAKAFLNAVYVNASVSQNDNVKALQNSALNVLKKLP